MTINRTRKAGSPTPVDSIRHQDTRANIPTEELRGFVADDEASPKTMRYPRDPSLDPQLVWKGKDEQDAADLAVPVVPIYIQEKIHPQALIDDLLSQCARPGLGLRESELDYQQLDMFADFNGLPEEFDQRVQFYQHEGHWSNRMILGDSLLVMTSLAEKEGLKGKVQTIYLDPPYGIKFGSNWQVSTRKRDVKDGSAEDATRQPEQVRAFRDTWKLGIHSYLTYMRDRFVVARELLTETGSIFIQISDENVHLVRCVLDEVFGSENHIANITYRVFGVRAGLFLDSVSDNIIWYAKERGAAKYHHLFLIPEKPATNEFEPVRLYRPGHSPGLSFEYEYGGHKYSPPPTMHWATTLSGLQRLEASQRLIGFKADMRFKRYAEDFPYMVLTTTWDDTWGEQEKSYVVQTSTRVIERCLLMTSDPGDLVLDPTCGSGTTAYVAEQWGRRWITCDTSRVALALARTRLMAAKYHYYCLADDNPQIAQQSTDEEIKALLHHSVTSVDGPVSDVHKGFVNKRVPHITLKSIVNNPDIHEGMTREEVDEAIAKHTESETLYDQPYEDSKIVRVSGPFTVESLSPHRVLAADTDMDGSLSPEEAQRGQDFATMIIANLRTAGAQNTKQGERIRFSTLEPYAGAWLQAMGTYTDAAGKVKRVAVSLGPEQGTVGPQQVREAAKEAVQGLGVDVLLVCGFAFDPHVSEETKRYGRLVVLPVKMNPDLAMGDELLKKTGAGNLFMIFGEPDLDVRKQPDGKIVVEIKGLDVYDPTTGEIRSSSTDDIACWFIDTNYDGESFFVRHAYFTGAEEPYDKLKRALRAEVDESAWACLYSTISRPFNKPASGKIAVKVINHYGDEVLKVYKV